MQPSTRCVTDYFKKIPKIEKSFCLHRVVFPNTSNVPTTIAVFGIWQITHPLTTLYPSIMAGTKIPPVDNLPTADGRGPLRLFPKELSDIVYYKYKNCANARCTCRSKQIKLKWIRLIISYTCPSSVYLHSLWMSCPHTQWLGPFPVWRKDGI